MKYFTILCLLFPIDLYAEIIFDGSLGQQIELSGPEYEITEAGDNLFYSFESFNLSEGEIANCTGSDEIYNVISRVTGGKPSLINGSIASSMPEAFFYFLNPYGVAFGPNSSLNVQGSFHTSTAHVLRFPDGNDFDTVKTENTLLSVEEPSAFGFLSNDVASIDVQQARLDVSPFSTISFVGNQPTFSDTRISAGIGQIYVVGIDGEGEVGFKANFKKVDGGLLDFYTEFDIQAEQLADVDIQNSTFYVSGAKGGNIYIRGEQVVLETSRLFADTGNHGSGVIDIQARDLTIKAGSYLQANSTLGAGNGGDILLTVENNLLLTGEYYYQGEDSVQTTLQIKANTSNAGNIQLSAKNIQLTDGASIFASSTGLGQGGHVYLKAIEKIELSGITSQGLGSQIGVKSIELPDPPDSITPQELDSQIGENAQNSSQSQEADTGSSTIQLNAQSILLADGAQVDSSTTSVGNGGSFYIKAQDLTISGGAERIDGRFIPTALTATAVSSGHAGDISIETTNLNLINGAYIQASSNGTGNGGNISILTQNFNINDKASVVANSQGTMSDAGRGGNIQIKTENLTVQGGGQFTSSVTGTGSAGNIFIEVA